MKNRILLAALLAGALVTVSCNKDRTLYYNSLEMGVLQADGRIITDGGLTYSVTENGTEYSGKCFISHSDSLETALKLPECTLPRPWE